MILTSSRVMLEAAVEAVTGRCPAEPAPSRVATVVATAAAAAQVEAADSVLVHRTAPCLYNTQEMAAIAVRISSVLLSAAMAQVKRQNWQAIVRSMADKLASLELPSP